MYCSVNVTVTKVSPKQTSYTL